jgi:hypothetical protein
MSALTLKDMAKLSRLKMSELAEQLGMEYGHLSTAMSMDEKGEEPKRKSVKERQAQIREHLEVLLKISERNDDTPKRKAELWDSPEVAAKRCPHPRGCTVSYEYNEHVLGSYVRLTLDPGAEALLCRFLRAVTSPSGKTHIDVIATANGAFRSLTPEQLEAGGRY